MKTMITSHNSTCSFQRNNTSSKVLLPAMAAVGLAFGGSSAKAAVITDFSTFSETGNLLTSPNTREQTFTPSAGSITVTSASGSNAGQEYYMSDAFASFGVGSRISLDLSSFTSSSASETIAITIANREDIQNDTGSSRIYWGWRPSNTNELNALSFDGAGNAITQPFNSGTTVPNSVFIERSANGWTFGSITGVTETIHLNEVTQINGVNITTDGSAIGLYSDMRDNSTWTVSNFDAVLVPEPSSSLLLLSGVGLMVARRRRG